MADDVVELAEWRAQQCAERMRITMAKLQAVDPIAAEVIQDYTANLVDRLLRGESLADMTEDMVEEELTRLIAARRGTTPDDVA